MATPHKHAELIKKWADDPSQCIWVWNNAHAVWVQSTATALIMYPDLTHAVGPKPAQPPQKTCVLCGVVFPSPVTDAAELREGCEYFITAPGADTGYWILYWDHTAQRHQRFLEYGLIHLTREAAEAHSRALVAVSKQAIKEAK